MKETITVAELKRRIMFEIRKYPECKEITAVAITRPATTNWDVTFFHNADPYICPKAREAVRDLKQWFDLEI